MRAMVNTEYGGPGVVRLSNESTPVPTDKQVLIKVYATTVNRTDCGFRSANYFITRFWSGLFKPKNKILGCEFAGMIESIGKEVTQFQPGDKVFGYNDDQFGAHAEYMVMPAAGAIATMPENMSFEEAAALTEGSHYALIYLKAAGVGPGHTILINGGTGGIGSAAVQIARHLGARITAVCAGENAGLVRSLGAHTTIDYKFRDFTKIGKKVDVVFDAVGKSSFGKCKPLLKENGVYMSTELGFMAQNPFLALTTRIYGTKKVLFPIPPPMNKEVTLYLKELYCKGKFKPLIDRTYALEEIPDAYRYVETGEKIGNVIVKIRDVEEA